MNYQILDTLSICLYVTTSLLFIYHLSNKNYLKAFFYGLFPLFIIVNFMMNREIEKSAALILQKHPILHQNISYEDQNLTIYYDPNVSRNDQYNIYQKKNFLVDEKIDEIIHSDAVPLEYKKLEVIRNDKNYEIHYPKFHYTNDNCRFELSDTVKWINLNSVK